MTHSGDNRKLSEGEWQPHCDVSGRLARSISEALLSKWQLPIRRAVSVVFCHFLVSNATNGSHFFIVAIDSVRCVRCVRSVLSVRSVRCVLSVRSVRCVFCYSRGPTGDTSFNHQKMAAPAPHVQAILGRFDQRFIFVRGYNMFRGTLWTSLLLRKAWIPRFPQPV